jgi:hypothetical protein
MIPAILICGLALMLFNLYRAMQLRTFAPGGIIGERMVQLTAFIALFAAGYLGVGLMVIGQEANTLLLILSLILVFGAVFVQLVLRLVDSVVGALEVE